MDSYDNFAAGLSKLKAAGVNKDIIRRYFHRELENDVKLFCKVILPHLFTEPFGAIHDDLFKRFNSDNRYEVIAYPRKHGKTTCLKGFLLWCILYKKFKYIVYLGDTQAKIDLHFSNIKKELETNRFLIELYGDLKSVAHKWNDEQLWIRGGIHVVPMSKGKSFRGLLDDIPPDLVVIDDLDDDEMVESPLQREKLNNWFFSNMLQAIDQRVGKVRMIGTVLHEDCQLMKVSNNPSWNSVIHACMDENEDPVCPELYTRERLHEIRENLFNAKPLPMTQTWWQEWMNKPVNPDNQGWDVSGIKWWEGSYIGDKQIRIDTGDGEPEIKDVNVYTAVDIASSRSTSRGADFSTVLTAAIDSDGNLYLLKYFRERNAQPSEVIDEIFNHHRAYNTEAVFIELVACQDLIMETYDQRSWKEPTSPILNEIRKRKERKVDRIRGALQDRLRLNKIHLKDGMSELYDELASFPRGAHDDLLDPLSDIAREAYLPISYNQKKKSTLPPELQSDNSDSMSAGSFVQKVVNW